MAELPLRKRIYFGMAGLSMNLPDLIVAQWIFVRYTPADLSKHLVPAFLCGALLLMGRTIEGVANTIVGHRSDVCRSRWGRRLPFMRFGIAPFAVVFFLLFSPPMPEKHWVNSVYLFLLALAYFPLYTTCFTPYLALLPEISSDIKGRVDLTTAQSLFMVIGTFIFAGVGPIIDHFGWTAMAGFTAILILLFYLPVATRIQEKPRPTDEREQLRYWHSIVLTLKNRPFRFVVFSTSFYWYGLAGILALVPFWTQNFLGLSKSDVAYLMLPFLLVNVAAFFVFNALVERVGKYALMLVTFLGTGLCMMSLCLVGYVPFGSTFVQSAVLMGVFGIPVAGFMVLPFAILADVVDYDEGLTGRRREAIFFGVQGIFQKAMIGMAMLSFTVVPYLGGAPGQEGVTTFGMKLTAFLGGVSCLIGCLIFLGYPLRKSGGKIAAIDT